MGTLQVLSGIEHGTWKTAPGRLSPPSLTLAQTLTQIHVARFFREGGNLPSGNSVDLTEEFRELAEAIILKSKGTQKVVYSESSFIKAQAVPKCFV